MKKQYCGYCGHLEVLMEGQFYDTTTGKKQKYLDCPNKDCRYKSTEPDKNMSMWEKIFGTGGYCS